jgi:cytoskeletal protein CcmA (bactofilin family)
MNLLLFFMPGFYISKRTVVNGNISTNENGRIDGIVNGDIESRAHLTIQKNGIINGDVYARDLLVKGKIKGNVQCSGKVYVAKQAEVHGNIYASEVIIDKEGLFKGGMAQLHEKDNLKISLQEEEQAIQTTASVLAEKPVVGETPQTWF